MIPALPRLKKRELLTEEKYQEAMEKHGANFKAKIGAEAIRDLLKEIDLDVLCRKLRKDLEKSKDLPE